MRRTSCVGSPCVGFGAAYAVLRALVVIAALVYSHSASSITLSIKPKVQQVLLGSAVNFDVAISGLGAGVPPSLGTFDFDLRFDPTILAFAGITFGDPSLGDQLGPVLGSISGFTHDPGLGLVNQFEVSLELPGTLDSLQPDSFVLTTVSFSTRGIGTSGLDILNMVLGDSGGLPLSVDTIENGSVTVSDTSSIPDSGNAGLLFGISLVALFILRIFQPSWKR